MENTRPNITVVDGYTVNPGDTSWQPLVALGQVQIYDQTIEDQFVDRCIDSDIIVVNKFHISSTHLEQLPNLKLILVSATGFDNVDTLSAREKNIGVCNAPNYSSNGVAQHVFAMAMHILHRVDMYDREAKKGKWSDQKHFSYWNFPIIELKGLTMGLFGYGNIAKAVARIANGFGMRVLTHSRSKQSGSDGHVQFVDFGQLISDSDIISLHAPLNAQTEYRFDADVFETMKNDSILINTARGALIDNSALYDALLTGKIRAAGLDVLEQEPPPHDLQLFQLDNCFFTPHQAWGSLDSRNRLIAILADNIRMYLKGEPINLVN